MPEPEPRTMVCVLGCRVGSAALVRRADVAAEAFFERDALGVVACGGRAWGDHVEADALMTLLRTRGVPEASIVRERCSLDTRDNARFAAALLGRRGLSHILLVTCAWHLPRAEHLFRRAGLEVDDGIGVEPPQPTRARRVYWRVRERLALMKDLRREAVIA